MMIVCTPCRQEMKCERTGVRLRFAGGSHVYHADRYLCPNCGTMAAVTDSRPTYDSTPRAEWDPDLDIDMTPDASDEDLLDFENAGEQVSRMIEARELNDDEAAAEEATWD